MRRTEIDAVGQESAEKDQRHRKDQRELDGRRSAVRPEKKSLPK
jgi:hypothetical protein